MGGTPGPLDLLELALLLRRLRTCQALTATRQHPRSMRQLMMVMRTTRSVRCHCRPLHQQILRAYDRAAEMPPLGWGCMHRPRPSSRPSAGQRQHWSWPTAE
jgi:hypothetical protein